LSLTLPHCLSGSLRRGTIYISQDFAIPEGIVFKEIDKNTGKLATGACPDVIQEAFIRGTEPGEFCSVHKENLIQWIMRKILDYLDC